MNIEGERYKGRTKEMEMEEKKWRRVGEDEEAIRERK